MNFSLIKEPKENLDVIDQILNNRNLDRSYLSPTKECLNNPLLFNNMKRGAEMLVKHIAANDYIYIQPDDDCDGYTSSALLINYLHSLFPYFVETRVCYSMHPVKGHGILVESVPDNVKLIIAPDSSSEEIEKHKYFYDKGIDVLVLDHHHSDELSPYACVINHQLDNYPNKTLSGVGVVWKFCQYIDSLLNQDKCWNYTDLVAVGDIADIMSLANAESRYIIAHGLEHINNPFLKDMIELQDYSLNKCSPDGSITPFGIAFYIAPYMNAVCRSGTPDEKLTLFESMLDYKGTQLVPSTKRGCKGQQEELAVQACRYCNNIKNRQTKAKEASLEIIERKIQMEGLLDNKILIVALNKDEALAPTLNGLVANELASKYCRPTLILGKKSNEEGIITYEGSGRNFEGSPIPALRTFLLQQEGVLYVAGHEAAFGVGIAADKLQDFINSTNIALKAIDFSKTYLVDFIWDSANINTQDILTIGSYKKYYGKGVEEPKVAITNINITKDMLTLLEKGPTLKINLPSGITVIKFRSSEEEYKSLYSDLGCVKINVVGTCEINSWGGRQLPQITIVDYEIVGRTAYYF